MKYLPWVRILMAVMWTACMEAGPEPVPEELAAKPVCIASWQDSIFVQATRSLVHTPDGYLLSDTKNDRLIMLDSSLKEAKTIGRRGKGPGEFMGNYHLAFHHDSIFVFDATNRNINIFSASGTYLNQIDLPHGVDYSGRFTLDQQSYFYFSTPRNEYAIARVNRNGKLVQSFGHSSHNLKSVRHLFTTEQGEILSIVAATGLIERYSQQGNLIEQYELSAYPFIQSTIHYISDLYKQRNYHWDNIFFSIIGDAYYSNGSLFLLIREHPPQADNAELMIGTKVLVVQTTPALRPVILLDLCNGQTNCSYLSLCVSADQSSLLAYELFSGQICTFSLPEATQE